MHDDMKAAVDSLDQTAAARQEADKFVASNGLRLQLKRVPQMVMLDAARRLKTPEPPRVWIEGKGREEPNPQDPGYVQALQNHQYDVGMLAVNTYFILGTKVIEPLPEGLDSIDSDEWADTLRAVDPDVDIPSSGPRRYLAWLKYYALVDKDQTDLLQKCLRYNGGTMERDVMAAQASFRNNAARDPLARLPTPAEDTDGPGNGTSIGNGAGVRSEGGSPLHAVPMAPVDRVDEF